MIAAIHPIHPTFAAADRWGRPRWYVHIHNWRNPRQEQPQEQFESREAAEIWATRAGIPLRHTRTWIYCGVRQPL